MKKILMICLLVMFMMPMRAEAFSWSNFFSWLFGDTQTVVDTALVKTTTAQMNTYKTQITSNDKLAKTYFAGIVSLLSTSAEAKAVEEKLNADNADIFAIMNEYQKTINSDKARVLITIKTMNDTDKAALSKNVTELYSIGQRYSEISKSALTAKTTVLGATNQGEEQTAVLNLISEVSDASTSRAKVITSLSVLIKAYAKLTGLSIQ